MKHNESRVRTSVVIPVYQEEDNLRQLHDRLVSVFRNQLDDKAFEVIYVNDGSADNSLAVLRELAEGNDRVVVVDLTRNYGQHNAIMCGFAHASGEYVITLDADMQTPPEEIPKLLELLEHGYDVVYGTYGNKKHSAFRNLGSRAVRSVYSRVFGVKVPITSFRAIRAEIVNCILCYRKSFTFIDGLLPWYTTRIAGAEVAHCARSHGRSAYSLSKLVALSLNLLTNHSLAPLQVSSVIGVISSTLGLFLGAIILLKKLVWGIPVEGFASLFVSVTVLAGIQLLTVGILGEYVGRLHLNASQKPQYAVRQVFGAPHSRSGATPQRRQQTPVALRDPDVVVGSYVEEA